MNNFRNNNIFSFVDSGIIWVNTSYKMNQIVNTFLLAREKSMSAMHLRQTGFRYSGCEQFYKNKERIKKFKETHDSLYIYRKELSKKLTFKITWFLEFFRICLEQQFLIKYCMIQYLIILKI